tara:strand:+ start:79 stop:840 length:762 start_codon:yes stop_codon:yes gene_type:complete
MQHIISFSGGLGSFFAAKRVVDKYGAEDCTLLFTDTKEEDEDLYRFMDDASRYLGLPVTTIADGRDLWEVFNDVKFMGNNRIDPCSRILKRELAREWMEANHEPEDAVLYMGIGWDEAHRMEAITSNWEPYTVIAPMVDPPYMGKPQMIEGCKEIGIKHPRLYDHGFFHNNCGGFCVKSGQAQFAKLLSVFPDRYKRHEQEQEKLFTKIKPHGFIRMTIHKKTKYLTLREFREYVEGDGQIDLFETGGCGCFV